MVSSDGKLTFVCNNSLHKTIRTPQTILHKCIKTSSASRIRHKMYQMQFLYWWPISIGGQTWWNCNHIWSNCREDSRGASPKRVFSRTEFWKRMGDAPCSGWTSLLFASVLQAELCPSRAASLTSRIARYALLATPALHTESYEESTSNVWKWDEKEKKLTLKLVNMSQWVEMNWRCLRMCSDLVVLVFSSMTSKY